MYRWGWAALGGSIQKCSRRWAGRSGLYRRSAGCDRQAAGGPRAGAGPAWRRCSAGVALACAKELALSPGGSAEGPAAKGTAPPRHSTQCQPPCCVSAGGAVFWSASGCTPSAEHTWCTMASAGWVAKAGVMTAAANDRTHQANTPAVNARARRRWWNRERVRDMAGIGSTAILPR